jgi:hypothetical protein
MAIICWSGIFLFLCGIPCCLSFANLRWYAPFYSGGGYSSEALDFVRAAAEGNIPVAVYQHGDSFNNKYVNGILSRNSREFLYAHDGERGGALTGSTSHINVCHSEPGAWSAPTPNYRTSNSCPPHSSSANKQFNIGRTMFETSTIPSGWSRRINMLDEVWVPTEFSRQSFVDAGVDSSKVRVVPEPVDTHFYRPIDVASMSSTTTSTSINKLLQHRQQLSADTLSDRHITIFLFVGKWETRKGIKELVAAFVEEFCSDVCEAGVYLAILSSQYHSSEPISAKLMALLDEIGYSDVDTLPPIVLLEDIDQEYMPVLYSLSNAVVIPSFGEGWGRPHVEALACGTPVIATNWSGVTAYLTPSNGYPIAIEDRLVASK